MTDEETAKFILSLRNQVILKSGDVGEAACIMASAFGALLATIDDDDYRSKVIDKTLLHMKSSVDYWRGIDKETFPAAAEAADATKQ
jgi:hypothetical protein